MYIISRYSMAIIIFDTLDRLANLFVCMQLMTHVDKYQNIRTTIATASLAKFVKILKLSLLSFNR